MGPGVSRIHRDASASHIAVATDTGSAGADMTGADGSFEVAYQQPAPYPPNGITCRYRAEFPGDSAYIASRSPDVAGP